MEIEGHKIKMSEFYERYWRVKYHNGNLLEVKLTEMEKLLMDVSEEMGLDAWVKTGGRKSSFKWYSIRNLF